MMPHYTGQFVGTFSYDEISKGGKNLYNEVWISAIPLLWPPGIYSWWVGNADTLEMQPQ